MVKSAKVLPASIKLINPIQKYPHITESFDYILKIFATAIDLLQILWFLLDCVQFQKDQSK